MVYRDMLESIHDELVLRKQDLEKESALLPDGSLYTFDYNGKREYFQRLPKKGNRKKERRIGIKNSPEILSSLVRKKYVTEALKAVDADIALLAKTTKNYKPLDENSVMKPFIDRYPELTECIYYGAEDLDEWASSYTPQNDFYTEGLTSTASDGTSRRSMGEILIGAKLRQYNIPYRYEAPAHPDLRWVPDFTIRRPRDGKYFYWEHFGKVSDREYMQHNLTKLEDYADVGIVPWDNLIITYSREDGGINEKLIDAMIHAWLL